MTRGVFYQKKLHFDNVIPFFSEVLIVITDYLKMLSIFWRASLTES